MSIEFEAPIGGSLGDAIRATTRVAVHATVGGPEVTMARRLTAAFARREEYCLIVNSHLSVPS